MVRVRSANAPGEETQWFSFTLGQEAPSGTWIDYLQGLTWALQQSGYSLPTGLDLQIESQVPLGAGLSSSAALEVSGLRAIRAAFNLDLDDVNLALIGQRAENDFVGARCGIMDQMAASLADASSALFLDTRSLEYQRVPLPTGADLVVIHSGVSHEISGGEYNARRAECEEAARLLDVGQLRDLTPEDLPRVAVLPEPLNGRAKHVVTEDERVLAAVAALEQGDLVRLGQLFGESHASMRDDFEVSVPDVDLLVEIAQTDPDVFGARMTGGGFGGSIVVLARAGTGPQVGERVVSSYADRSGRQPTVLVPPA